MFNSTSAFIKEPTLEHWQAVMSAWNGTVNVFHNTGKFLNKFISNTIMDQLAKAPVFGLVSAMVGSLAVHDEDFPLHRNASRVSDELAVVIPKAKKVVKPVVLDITATPSTMSFEARWRMKTLQGMYLQIRLSMPLTKDYGTALDVVISSKSLAKALHGCYKDGTSMAGTPTPCGTGLVRMIDGKWVLVVTQNNLWVPLRAQAMEGIIASLKAHGQVDESDNEAE